MKKILVSSVMAAAALVFVVPGVASAAQPSQKKALPKPSERQISLCETRVKKLKTWSGSLEIYQKGHFTMPEDLSAYKVKNVRVLGGDVGGVRSAKADSGLYAKRTNYVLVADRFEQAAKAAKKWEYTKGSNTGKKVVPDTSDLDGNANLLRQTANGYAKLASAASNSLKEGYKYDGGKDYGAGQYATKDQDKSFKAPRDFTVSFDAAQCQTINGVSNVAFLNHRYYSQLRVARNGIKESVKVSKQASAEYTKIANVVKAQKKIAAYKP